jgi:hypothetical protein
MGSSLSVLDFVQFGSSMSVRHFMKIGSSMSIQGDAVVDGQITVGSHLSVRSYVRFGATVSLFGIARLGATLSVLDYSYLGSSLSLRSLSRLGSSLSVIDIGYFGSSLSLRGISRLGSQLSIFGALRVGNRLSVEGDLHIGSALYFGTASTYLHYDSASSEFRIVAGGNKRFSLTSSGGSLHGTWSTESILSASDRRLKRRIEPLHRVLAKAQMQRGLASSSRVEAYPSTNDTTAHGAERHVAVDWMLRQLRPVSFSFRKSAEAKKFEKPQRRYGFIAQEVESVLPDMVEMHQEAKHVAYQDMIAVLTLASQVQQERLAAHERRAEGRAQQLSVQARKLRALRRGIGVLDSRISRWEKRISTRWRRWGKR